MKSTFRTDGFIDGKAGREPNPAGIDPCYDQEYMDGYRDGIAAAKNKNRKPTHISGRRWFQRTYGNTYNSVTIHFDDGSSEYLPMTYGYGDYYLQRAESWIKQNYEYPDQLQGTRFLREVCGITWGVSDVSRQKDL